ncbi:MAG: hypothetical protein H6607_05675 [Flavobacteriales bacterium]|nr:hypothetical protein [Flavobacteriales bacterium]
MQEKNSALRNILSDREFWMLLAFNISILVAYYLDRSTASMVVLVYFLQSVFIGLQYFIRLIAEARRTGKSEGKTPKYGMALFFMFHYGMFHLVYIVFLFKILIDLPGKIDYRWATILFWVFMANGIFSGLSDAKKDAEGTSGGFTFFEPYFRIVPMHLLIIFGFNNSFTSIDKTFLFFIGLKTLADLLMHIVTNKTFKHKRPNATEGWI